MSHPFDPLAFKKAIKNLQGNQDEISSISHSVLQHPVAAEAIFQLMLDEAAASSARRLLIFYLCNDILQHASRKGLTDFLEKAASVFFPGFASFIFRLPIAERGRYLRVVEIWKERRVFSENFCNRLHAHWSSAGPVETSVEEPATKKIKSDTIAKLAVLTESIAAVCELNSSSSLIAKMFEDTVLKLTDEGSPETLGISLENISQLDPRLSELEDALAKELQAIGSAIVQLSAYHETVGND